MATVELDLQEWQQVISALAMTNPLLMKISIQLQQQQAREAAVAGLRPGNSGFNQAKDSHHEL